MSTVATTPKPDIHGAIRELWNHRAQDYDREPGHGIRTTREEWAWRRILAAAFDRVQTETPLRILDVGCGTGAMTMLIANMGYAVTGLDLSPEMLAVARDQAEERGLPITLMEGRADKLPFEDGAFDVVFSRHLLWTLPRPRKALGEWARVTRPGGMVAVSDGWWEEPGSEMRARRAIGGALRAVLERPSAASAAYRHLRPSLPLAGGLSPYSIRYYLDHAGLERIVVRDLKTIRAAERRSMPPWRWIDQARFTWIATGMVPE
ncbi:MAG TPA: class I SAM-dependent methyltransferase [Chloroflexota bacterium]|nr:class I SAM-dependent methyltransferase [Chloroflexota bacterium]